MALPQEDRGVNEADDVDTLLGDKDDFCEFGDESQPLVDDDADAIDGRDSAGVDQEPEL